MWYTAFFMFFNTSFAHTHADTQGGERLAKWWLVVLEHVLPVHWVQSRSGSHGELWWPYSYDIGRGNDPLFLFYEPKWRPTGSFRLRNKPSITFWTPAERERESTTSFNWSRIIREEDTVLNGGAFSPPVRSAEPKSRIFVRLRKGRRNSDRTTASHKMVFGALVQYYTTRFSFFFNGFSRSIQWTKRSSGGFLLSLSPLFHSSLNSPTETTRAEILLNRKEEAEWYGPGHKKSIHAILEEGGGRESRHRPPPRRRWFSGNKREKKTF